MIRGCPFHFSRNARVTVLRLGEVLVVRARGNRATSHPGRPASRTRRRPPRRPTRSSTCRRTSSSRPGPSRRRRASSRPSRSRARRSSPRPERSSFRSHSISGLSSAMPRIRLIAACVWVLTRPGITTAEGREIFCFGRKRDDEVVGRADGDDLSVRDRDRAGREHPVRFVHRHDVPRRDEEIDRRRDLLRRRGGRLGSAATRDAAPASAAHNVTKAPTRPTWADLTSALFTLEENLSLSSDLTPAPSSRHSRLWPELERVREKRREADLRPPPAGRLHDDVDVAALVPEDLTAGPAGRRRLLRRRHDGDGPKPRTPSESALKTAVRSAQTVSP